MTGYVAVIDPYPHQSKQLTKLYKFYEYLKEGRLVTTRCTECGHVTWPPKTMCPECASAAVEWADLPGEGTVVGYTVAERGIPAGFPIPTVFVLVQVGPVRILSRLIDAKPEQVELGMTVVPDLVKIPGDTHTEERVLQVFRLKKN